MGISKSEALRIFRDRYRSPELTIHGVGQTGASANYPFQPNAWFVRFSLDDMSILRPTRLLCISKSGVEILIDDSVSDEG